MEENKIWTPEDFRKYREQKIAEEKKNSKNKFKNKWTTIDGIKFQSTAEGNAYVEYKRQKDNGYIKDFKRQVMYEFIINGIKVSSYRADFVVENNDGTFQIVDVKSVFTRTLNDYVIRKKLMKACFDIEIHER